MNELIASEKLDELFISDTSSGEAARSIIAFSLAVKKGLSLESAEMWVVMPMRSFDASYGLWFFEVCRCTRERFLCDLTIMKMMMPTRIDSEPD